MKCRRYLSHAFFIMMTFCGCRETILHSLDELAANKVKVILARTSIAAEKVRDGTTWSIAVPTAQANQALSVLEASRALKPELLRSTQASSSLIQSREEKMQIFERQLAWNLEGTLERFPGVLEARVHLFLEPHDAMALKPSKTKQSASVLLIIDDIDGIDANEVRKLIAGASGVSIDDITVLFNKPDAHPEPDSQISLAGTASGAAPITLGNQILPLKQSHTVLVVIAAAVFLTFTFLFMRTRRLPSSKPTAHPSAQRNGIADGKRDRNQSKYSGVNGGDSASLTNGGVHPGYRSDAYAHQGEEF